MLSAPQGNTMKKLHPAIISPLPLYRQQRPLIRRAMIEHKKSRRLSLGPHITLHFEDYMTMKYQVQEMVYIEQLSDEAAIQEEIDVYSPLIPDGTNLKCTMMLEFPLEHERRVALRKLVGVEHLVYLQVAGFEPIAAVADEDLPRSTPDKTSAVHFLRFEFTPAMIDAARRGANWIAFTDHPLYSYRLEPVPARFVQALMRDFTDSPTDGKSAAPAREPVSYPIDA